MVRPALVLLALAGLALAPFASGRADDGAGEAAAAKPETYLRLNRDVPDTVALEVAVRTFRPVGGKGPTVRLVGVAHIAEASLYEELQRLLDAHDRVLYESVLPEGAGEHWGETDEERAASTTARLRFLAGVVEGLRVKKGVVPEGFDELLVAATAVGPRLASMLERTRDDAWGRPIQYARTVGVASKPTARLSSYGSDGVPGGQGHAADLAIDSDEVPPLRGGKDDDNLQAQLADALGLAYQLDGIDYARERWQVSDMALDQVRRAVEARGGDFSMLDPDFASQGISRILVKGVLGLLGLADKISGGRVRVMVRAVLVAALAQEAVARGDMGSVPGLDQGLMDALIKDRNAVVIRDLKAVLAEPDPPAEIAIFYGAGHMADLEQRLGSEVGYAPTDTAWHRAIEVDLTLLPESMRDLDGLTKQIEEMLGRRRGD